MSSSGKELQITNYKNAFVGLLDILGFSQLAESNEHEDLMRLYSMFVSAIQKMQHITHIEVSDSITINYTFISDSIIVWTHDSSIEEFKFLMHSITNLMYVAAQMGLPLRGNVTYGDIAVFNNKYDIGDIHQDGKSKLKIEQNIIIGKSIVEVYNEANRQVWAGCTVNPKCLDIIRSQDEGKPMKRQYIDYVETLTIIKNYPVPYQKKDKTGSIEYYEENAIIIPYHFQDLELFANKEKIIQMFGAHGKKLENNHALLIMENSFKQYTSIKPVNEELHPFYVWYKEQMSTK